jgi:hypothetical protein
MIISLVGFLFFTGCNSNKKNPANGISRAEKAIFDSLGFDANILLLLRRYTDSSVYIHQISQILKNNAEEDTSNAKHIKGISFKAQETEAGRLVLTLKDLLYEKGYLIYISESNFGHSPDEVSILKSQDQFDILLAEETNGINYGIENKDVIAKLRQWHEQYPFRIIGADFDYMEAIFLTPPSDLEEFSKELYGFCPDVVDQGTGSIEKLVEEIKNSGVLYLWWD